MAMSMASMASATPSPSSTSTMSMSSSDASVTESMAMVFFSATDTALWSARWTPNGQGQYAGTCIFLIVLSAAFRSLLAIRSNLTYLYDRATPTHRTDLPISHEKHDPSKPRPWKISEALVQSVFDTILAGVGYLLMLAVMTYNVGYFLSVLGGVLLGSFVFGRWTGAAVH